jgi:hypothetical protein
LVQGLLVSGRCFPRIRRFCRVQVYSCTILRGSSGCEGRCSIPVRDTVLLPLGWVGGYSFMRLSAVAPLRTTLQCHWEGHANVDLRVGFQWSSILFMRPRKGPQEQMLFDIGKSGKSPHRIQLFIDCGGALVFQIENCPLEIPTTATETLANKWTPLTVMAQVKDYILTMCIIADAEFEWAEQFRFDSCIKYAARMRIGAALTGGCALEMELLDTMLWGVVHSTTKVKKLQAILKNRPKEFGLEYGSQ